ncbi:diadenylate cyclase CdaA [Persicitalea jodogahamensis]|uniref:Diadenylate cyclase n=1 Tax=Persicitalea jodogahamensis TaxID=402147 RepID=A0A8J3GA36_9BACT|nr:diadenylate cyclase CdaA [Persicitalea jodogahamensis]GHB80449.1 TIGR00159 family protein [Persicitalea jodogahamensis]
MRIGFLTVEWTDLLDITLVAFLLYQVYYLVKGSIASRVFLGCIFVYVFYLIVKGLRLELLTTILQYFMGVGAIALIVIFQQEIRRFLLMIGKSTAFSNNRLFNTFFGKSDSEGQAQHLKKIADAVRNIAADFNGAIVVIKKNDDLEKFVQTGEVLDATISRNLLISIFNQYSALHEGATIVSDGRIAAARCILPVADGIDVPPSIGFRHRAALGMSEATDAVVLVVSEQTGRISLAVEGKLIGNISTNELETRLADYLNAD